MRVLLIDDDEDLRVAVQLALKTHGIQADGFGDCDAAMAFIERDPDGLDAVLLDLHLDNVGTPPETFVTWMKKGPHAKVPVVLMTAAHDPAARTREFGADGYLAKPFDVASLLRRVQQLKPA
jgi:DNA-binding response OmpR family regulator